MVRLLTRGSPAVAAMLAAAGAAAQLEAGAGRHAWSVEAALAVPDARTPLGAWTDGGLGKLRTAADEPYADRLVFEYRGRIASTVDFHAVADYVADASAGVDLTEAYVEWRPVPTRALRQQWRFGGFHPRLSLENVAGAWSSPFSMSYSAVNTWLGEEVRNFGAEWLGRRNIGGPGSPHELAFNAGLFYGNDPAGTLLFWRGWSLHGRQSRFGDRLTLPPRPEFGAGGNVVGHTGQQLEPFTEVDGVPGAYASLEWKLRRRALVRVSRYDNRADPLDFASGHWSWQTTFDQVAVQLELPLGLGLVAQRLSGRTRWLVGGRADGSRSPGSRVVGDDFAARFVLLTRPFGKAHRVTLRRDEFSYDRDASPSGLELDAGEAWTASYRYRASQRLAVTVEWLEIDSTRSIRPGFYALPARAEERQLQLRFEVRTHGSTAR